ncbi:efflux RND transporter permease subunit [bacterium]|nr:efflux RND transporter permease subunit [bacterium]
MGSLIISLTITPVFATFLFKKEKRSIEQNKFLSLIQRGYAPLLAYALGHTKQMIWICTIVFGLGLTSYFLTGSEFMPEMDESSLLVDILLPPETSLTESSRIASLVAQRVSQLDEVQRVIRVTGKARADEHAAPVNLTHSNCVLVPKEKRHASIDEIKAQIRAVTENIPGVNIQINAPLQHRINHIATGIRSAIAVKIFGANMETIAQLAAQVEGLMESVPGVTDLQVEQIQGVPQLQVKLDRPRMARYGLNVEEVAHLMEIAFNGDVATELIETQRRYDIFVRYKEDYRKDVNALENLLIETPAGYRIPLSEVAQIIEDAKPAMIRRENALRRGVVQCNTAERDMGSVVNDIKAKLTELEMPDGYFITFGGTYENQIRAMRQLVVVVFLTIAIVFALLVLSFKSFSNALLIFINIPLALAGGMLILFFTGLTLSVPSIVGFIALIGIAVQDGIVLVTHLNNYRKKGLKPIEAAIKAGNNKLRPVLMTTLTTMFGLMPLALRNATGSEIQKPLAVVIMFGLLFSTLLTLLVLPSFYVALERRKD